MCSYTRSPSWTVNTRGSCAHRSAHLCLCCSLTQSARVLHAGNGGVRSESANCFISISNSISGVTLSFTYTCWYVPESLMPCISQVRPADKKEIFSALLTACCTSGCTSPAGFTHMRSTRSLGTRHANGVPRLRAALICLQIWSAGGAQIPSVYLSLFSLLTDSESW